LNSRETNTLGNGLTIGGASADGTGGDVAGLTGELGCDVSSGEFPFAPFRKASIYLSDFPALSIDRVTVNSPFHGLVPVFVIALLVPSLFTDGLFVRIAFFFDFNGRVLGSITRLIAFFLVDRKGRMFSSILALLSAVSRFKRGAPSFIVAEL
jgi:hypothetical protein